MLGSRSAPRAEVTLSLSVDNINALSRTLVMRHLSALDILFQKYMEIMGYHEIFANNSSSLFRFVRIFTNLMMNVHFDLSVTFGIWHHWHEEHYSLIFSRVPDFLSDIFHFLKNELIYNMTIIVILYIVLVENEIYHMICFISLRIVYTSWP